MSEVVDAEGVLVAGGRRVFENDWILDGIPYPFTGKTVLAVVRKTNAPNRVIDATLEDIAVQTPADGQVVWTMEPAQSSLLVTPPDPAKYSYYYVQYYVVEDNQYSKLLKVPVRRALI